MNLYDYIASNNPYEANTLLGNYGFKESDSVSTISERLKLIVRKFKKIGLQELYTIHPDRNLFNSFGKTNIVEDSFVNATGRTPEFVSTPDFKESIVAPPSNFITQTTELSSSQMDVLKHLQKDAVREMQKVKKEIVRQKRNRNRDNHPGKSKELSMNNLLMLGFVFAVGYMIGKK